MTIKHKDANARNTSATKPRRQQNIDAGAEIEQALLIGSTDEYYASLGNYGSTIEEASGAPSYQGHQLQLKTVDEYAHQGPILETEIPSCCLSRFPCCDILVLIAAVVGIWAFFAGLADIPNSSSMDTMSVSESDDNQLGLLLATFEPNYKSPAGMFAFLAGRSFFLLLSVLFVVVSVCQFFADDSNCNSCYLFFLGASFSVPFLMTLDSFPRQFEVRLLSTNPYQDQLALQARGRISPYDDDAHQQAEQQQQVLSLLVPTLIGPPNLLCNIQEVSYVHRQCPPVSEEIVPWEYFGGTQAGSNKEESVLVTAEACPTRLILSSIDVFWTSPCSFCINPSNQNEFVQLLQEQILELSN